MSYPVENARFEWEEGERYVRRVGSAERDELEGAVDRVVDELRRRLGSSFTLSELADFYAAGADWATDIASAGAGVGHASRAVDAAFSRYAREAVDFAGGALGDRP